MKKYFFLLMLLVGLMTCTTAPPSEGARTTDLSEIVALDNDVIFASGYSETNCQGQVLHYNTGNLLSVQFQDEIISIDKLNDKNLYASLSTGYQDISESPDETIGNSIGFFKEHWIALIIGFLAFVKIVVNLTTSERDNKIFAWFDTLINSIIPNLKKGGGKHVTTS